MNRSKEHTIGALDVFKYLCIISITLVLLSIPVYLNSFILFIPLAGISIVSIVLFLNDFRVKLTDLFSLIILLAILTPGIQLSSGLPSLRLEEILIFGSFPFILLKNYSPRSFNVYTSQYSKLYSLFLFAALISTVYGIIVLNVGSGSRDVVEFIKMVKYLLIFLVVATSSPTKQDLKYLLNIFLVVIALATVIGILQFYNVFGITSITAKFYLGENAYRVSDRLVGTFTNPNSFSVVVGISIIISFVLFLKVDHTTKKIIYLASITFFLASLLLTGSRTGLAAISFSLIVLLLLYLRYNLSELRLIVPLIIILAISLIIGGYYAGQEIVTRLNAGFNLLEDQSFLMRIYAWYLNYQLFLQSPILGWGPAKHTFTTVVDNEFVLFFRRYGLIGGVLFLSLYLYPLKLSISSYLKRKEETFTLIFAISLIFFLITNLTNSVYNHIQTMDAWFILLGCYFGSCFESKQIQST